jgi:signal transduction histidine kinase
MFDEASASGSVVLAIRLGSVLAVAHDSVSSRTAALDVLHKVIELARVGGVVSSIVDAGPQVGGLLETIARDKDLHLSVTADAPGFINGDARMLQRMVANLLDNAIRYTPQGGRIDITVHPIPGDDVAVVFQDTGIGIRAADLSRVFDRFFRCDPSRSASGTGLGLSLAQAVAMAHGGEITVQSEPGRGSTFQVLLPRNGDKIHELGSSV